MSKLILEVGLFGYFKTCGGDESHHSVLYLGQRNTHFMRVEKSFMNKRFPMVMEAFREMSLFQIVSIFPFPPYIVVPLIPPHSNRSLQEPLQRNLLWLQGRVRDRGQECRRLHPRTQVGHQGLLDRPLLLPADSLPVLVHL